MAHEDEPSVPESFWNALRREQPNERSVDRAYFRFTMARSFRRPPPRVFHYLVFGFIAGVAAVTAAASGSFRILRWLPLVPHESRASEEPWKRPHTANRTPSAVPSASASSSAAASAAAGGNERPAPAFNTDR